MRAVRLLRKHSVEFSVLCVVNRVNARKPIDVYRFLRDEVRPRTIQLIPAVESVDFRAVAPRYWREADLPVLGTPRARPGTGDSVVTDWSVDPEDWGYFLSRIWDEWLKKDFGQVFIDQFENAISQMLGFGAQKCVSSEFCGKALALEHNGDLYSCDHFVYPEYRLGNITETHEGDLVFSRIQNEFALAKSKSLPAYCRSCLYLKLCWGECPRNRFIKAPDGQAGLNYLCSGLKRFYQKVLGSRAEVIRRMRTGGGF